MPEANPRRPLTGLDRAAAFLMVLGEREASEILKHMDPTQIHQIADAMSNLPYTTKDQIKEIVREFFRVSGQESLLGGSKDAKLHIRKLLVMALGKERATDIITRVKLLDRRAGGMETLRRKDPREIADMVRMEHPQVTASLLSYLDPRQASEVLSALPEEVQQDVIMRIATLEGVPISAMEELNALIEDHFSDEEIAASTSSTVGGAKAAANIMNLMEGSVQSSVMDRLKEFDADLAQLIEDSMFTFDDLLRIDDRGIQALLAEVSNNMLATALKGAEEETKEKFFKNMSTRAAENLRDDMEVSGPVKLSEVESAQKEIVTIARRMMDDGKLVVGGVGGGDELVY